MKVLVDTTIWSQAFRRRTIAPTTEVTELKRLILDFQATLIGPIRQELLSGIAEPAQYRFLSGLMVPFANEAVIDSDYELAAEFFNKCRKKGLQGSNTDFLICAVGARKSMPIFTADNDFLYFAKWLPIALHKVAIRR